MADGKNTENKVLAIAHCNCPERAREIERMILDKIKSKRQFYSRDRRNQHNVCK